MTVDVRATVTCHIGGTLRPLISATVSDSYPSAGGGIIYTKGECVLNGLYSPASTSLVEFFWQKPSGGPRQVPRTLYVISYTADPLTRTTTVTFGCRFTMYREEQEFLPVQNEKSTPRTDLQEIDITWWKSVFDVPLVPCGTDTASIEYQACLPLGLTPSTAVNGYFILPVYPGDGKEEKWEFSSSYVSTLESLYASQGLYAAAGGGVVRTFGIIGQGGLAPLLDNNRIISAAPIGVGDLPATRYRTYFSFNRLQQQERALGDPTESCTESAGEELTRTVTYRQDEDLDDPDNEPTEFTFDYGYTPSTRTCVYRDEYGREYKVVETTLEYGLLDSYAALLASAGFTAEAGGTASAPRTKITTTSRTLDDADHVIAETVEVTHDRTVMLGALDLPYATPAYKDSTGELVLAELRVTAPRAGRFVVERIERTTGPEAADLRITTRRWVAYGYTPEGQQAIAEQGRDSLNAAVLNSLVLSGEQLIEQPVEWQTIEGAAKQWKTELAIAKLASESSGDNSKKDSIRVSTFGSRDYLDPAHAGTGAFVNKTLSLPMCVDDATAPLGPSDISKYVRSFVDGTTEVKVVDLNGGFSGYKFARKYASNVAKYEQGLRYGLSVQTDPSYLGDEYLQPVIVRLNYVNNALITAGLTYTMDATGIVASFDGLYVGVAGGDTGGAPIGPLPPEFSDFPPFPETVIDPDQGEVVNWDDVLLIPPFTPVLPIEGGIGIGVAAYRLDYDVARTQTAELGIGVGVTYEGEVPPTGVDVASITYTQSSVYPGTTAISNAIMTDGSFTNTGAATDADGAPEYITMDLGSTHDLGSVIIGTATDNIPGGWTKFYTQGLDVEYSTNGTDWTVAFNTGTMESNGIYTYEVDISARYIRIVSNSGTLYYVALSEFYALAPGQTYP